MDITNNTNDQDSWFSRNDWVRPLIASAAPPVFLDTDLG
ncbi:hypothetical protein B0G84_9061 [Paraburkholderia sp. BL8N3]|nr:hypothetical protein B0G84_9061 [Paraburkholderia sp. BL8N3]